MTNILASSFNGGGGFSGFSACASFLESNTAVPVTQESSIDMYNNDVGKRFMKQKGTLTSATLHFNS